MKTKRKKPQRKPAPPPLSLEMEEPRWRIYRAVLESPGHPPPLWRLQVISGESMAWVVDHLVSLRKAGLVTWQGSDPATLRATRRFIGANRLRRGK